MMKPTRRFLVVGLVWCSFWFLLGTTWNGAYELVPAGTDLASDLDIFIQGFKTEVRQRMEVEHIWGGSTDDNGLHQVGSARCFQQNTAPTDINSGTAALGQYNSSAGTDSGTLLSTDEVGATTRDIGTGRCWIDLDGPDNIAGTPDDRSLATWDETNDRWVYQNAVDPTVSVANQRMMFDPGKVNLLRNGGFEATDGTTGAVASTTVPSGWSGSGTPTHAYAASPAAQGDGLFYEVTAGADNSGISQTLKGLKASTTYYLSGMAQPVAGGDSCTLRTTGASTNASSTIAAGTAWTKLGSSFTTDATPTDVVVIAEADLLGDICRFDYLGAYETTSDRRPVTAGGGQFCWDTDSSTATNYGGGALVAVPGLSCAVTVPGDNYAIVVNAGISATNNDGGNQGLQVDLQENCGGGATSVEDSFAALTNNGVIKNMATVPIHYVKQVTTSGTTCTYTLQAASSGANIFSNDKDNDAAAGLADPFSWLSVELKPLR